MSIAVLEPTILIIFGVTGDLAKRKLLPALYRLVKDNLLHEFTEVIGVTRSEVSREDFFANIELCINEVDGVCDMKAVQILKSKFHLRQMDVVSGEAYDELLKDLNVIEDRYGMCMNRLYYLSVPPNVSEPIITFLGMHGLNKSCKHNEADTRLLTEKPFGYDLVSAQELMGTINQHFKEAQVFRIDHYLAKETVQNILTFRFNNPIFQPLWNSKFINYIEVVAEEKIGIEGRVKFYEQTGALRDLIQNHLLQILALVTMEQPLRFTSREIHARKRDLLELTESITPYEVVTRTVRGQYATYRQEVSNNDSYAETFAAVRLTINNQRWKNVSFIIRTGKSLKEKTSKVRVVFKPTKAAPHHNVLTFRLQPNEGIELSLRVKKPSFANEIQPAEMDFSYKRSFDDGGHPDAYERVLVDAVKGDHTLFATSQEILHSWRIIQPVLDEWAKNDTGLKIYKNGSTGPKLPNLWTTPSYKRNKLE